MAGVFRLPMHEFSDPSRPTHISLYLSNPTPEECGHDSGDSVYHPRLTQVPIFLRTPKLKSPSTLLKV